MNLSVLSTQNVYVDIKVTNPATGEPYNPTGDVVQMAFPPTGTTPADWLPASWVITPTGQAAYCLVGPDGGTELATDTYDVWWQVLGAGAENPTAKAGYLTVS